MDTPSCLGFHIECAVILKGGGVVAAGLFLFMGSVYVLLSAVFGRWMGYLILMVAFSGWMIIQSSMWAFGFWSLGPGTPVNLGPRGREASWTVLSAGLDAQNSDAFTDFEAYPAAPWKTVPAADFTKSDPAAISGAAVSYLAHIANAYLGRGEFDLDAVTASQFTVTAMSTADASDGTGLAVVQAHYNGGGPVTTLSMAYDSGNVALYSRLFLLVAALLFAIHVPLLDRAERSRKEFLTGGNAPAWYGPA